MRLIGILAGVAGLLVAAVCSAGTIRVPEDYPTVLAAADLAMPGDTVLVGAGTWSDRATRVIVARNGPWQYTACAYPRGGVVLRGQGAGVTVLDVGGSTGQFVSDVVFVEEMGQGALRIESMTLKGVRGSGGGTAVVGLFADGLEVRSCRLEDNDSSDGPAAVVLQCPLTMVDCEVVGNSAYSVVIQVADTPVHLLRCRFEGNTGRCLQTDYNTGSFIPAVIQDCEFIRNRGRGSGVALNLQSVGGYLVEGSLFLGNVAELEGGGAIRTNAGFGEIRRCVFAYDSCYAPGSLGGGIVIEGGSVSVSENTFVGCYAPANGGAFEGMYGAAGTLTRNVVAHSTGSAAVRFAENSSFTNGCNLFWQNQSGNISGGAMSATDFIADPFFCDLAALDFTVRNDSPCITPPTPSCAPIGALGVGCGTVSVESLSFGRVKALFR